MTALLPLAGCFLLGVLVNQLWTVPPRLVHWLNAWVLRIALPALILELLPRLAFGRELWFLVAAMWIVFAGGWFVAAIAGARLGWSRQRTGAIALVAGFGNTAFTGYPLIEALRGAERLYVIGRGTGLAVAMEAALKFKEVCGIHAEGYSGAEVQHGPMALVEDGFPMLVLAPRGPAQPGLLQLATQMRARGAKVLLAAPPGTPGAALPLLATAHEDLDPITIAQSFYRMVEALAHARGLDPDRPRHLAKVTRTE